MARMKYLALAAALAVGVSLSAQAASALTIVNGGFEDGPNPGVFSTKFNGDTSITGWEVGGHSIDYIGSYWQPSEGERSIDLSGNAKGSIFQWLNGLTVGNSYTIFFDLAGNPDGGASTKVAAASDGGTQASVYFFPLGGATKQNMNWKTESFTFTAFDTSVKLSFSATADDAYGPAIDNVRAVPEPATWALMILGFGGAGAMLRKRRVQFA